MLMTIILYLRCDSRLEWPNPCTRCEKRQLFCKINSSFQRKPVRWLAQALYDQAGPNKINPDDSKS